MAICHDPRSFGEKGSEPFPICEEHAKLKGKYWKLLPLPGQTETEEHPMVSEDRRYFRVVSDAVIASVKKSLPDQAQDVLKDVRCDASDGTPPALLLTMKTMTIQLRDEGSSESVVTFETGKHYPNNGFRILAMRGKSSGWKWSDGGEAAKLATERVAVCG